MRLKNRGKRRKRENIVRLNIVHVTERQNIVSVADPDLQIMGEGGGEGRSQKIFWGSFGPQFGLKIGGTRAPQVPPLDPPLGISRECCRDFMWWWPHQGWYHPGSKSRTSEGTCRFLVSLLTLTLFTVRTCQHFWLKCVRFSSCHDQNFRKMSQRPKISDNFPKTS